MVKGLSVKAFDEWWHKTHFQVAELQPIHKINPFTEEERDQILGFYRKNRPYWAYGFAYFRFYTGTRPSEATALKWGSVDLQSGKEVLQVLDDASVLFDRENRGLQPITAREHHAPVPLGSFNTSPNCFDAFEEETILED